MVKRHWVKRYAELPPASERLLTLQSWDTASKGGPDNDWSVCTTWIVTRKKRWYLIDVWRQRVDYPALKAAVQTLAKKWNAQPCSGRGHRRRDLARSGAARPGLGNHRRKAGGR